MAKWLIALGVLVAIALVYGWGYAAGEQAALKDSWVLQEDGTFREYAP